MGEAVSGGSYERWASTLERMAASCREWAASDRANHRYDDASKTHVPTTIPERAQIVVRAVLLERVAARLRGAILEIQALEGVMHDVEWVASGDMDVHDLMEPIVKGA